MNENLSCECKGWEYRQTCRHVRLISKLLETGATFGFPFEIQSSRDPRTTYRIEWSASASSPGLADEVRGTHLVKMSAALEGIPAPSASPSKRQERTIRSSAPTNN